MCTPPGATPIFQSAIGDQQSAISQARAGRGVVFTLAMASVAGSSPGEEASSRISPGLCLVDFPFLWA
jgi:hypothetical protein